MQRIQETPAKPKSAPVSEGFRQEELVSQAASSSSSQQWQTSQSQSWWSGWEWTAGQERWWEQTEWVQWQEPPVVSTAEAKQKAKSEKRAKQKALKVASGINVTKLKTLSGAFRRHSHGTETLGGVPPRREHHGPVAQVCWRHKGPR